MSAGYRALLHLSYSGVTNPTKEQIDAVAESIRESDKMPLSERVAVITQACGDDPEEDKPKE